MAFRARQPGVFTGQWEKGVVEIRGTPAVPGVASRAVVRKVLIHMARRTLEIRAMAGIAVLR